MHQISLFYSLMFFSPNTGKIKAPQASSQR